MTGFIKSSGVAHYYGSDKDTDVVTCNDLSNDRIPAQQIEYKANTAESRSQQMPFLKTFMSYRRQITYEIPAFISTVVC